MRAGISRRVIAGGAAGVALAGVAFAVPAVAHAHFLVGLMGRHAVTPSMVPTVTPATPLNATPAPAAAPPPSAAATPTSTVTPSAAAPTTALTARPASTAADLHAWIVRTTCTAAVLDTPSGSWLLTAAHCDTPESIDAAGRTWSVVDRVTPQGDLPAGAATEDLALLQVDGDLEAAVGGGFTVGTAVADGSTVSIRGYPSDSDELTGCDGLPVSVEPGGITADSCDLPDGTSGSPWYTADGVIHGMTGGPDDGGTSDWESESPRFTDETLIWVSSVVG